MNASKKGARVEAKGLESHEKQAVKFEAIATARPVN
jgi:hypothetical protein